jgi:broad specificity phosphatase PhoE
VTEVVRLTFVSHAMTDAMAGGRFATDEPLNATGRRQVDASIDLGIRSRSGESGCTALTGPKKRTHQTAERHCQVGDWCGRSG